MSDLLLGVDIGTASTKGVLATSAGTIVAAVTRKHSMSLPKPGWAEMDAEAIWWHDVVEVTRELMAHVGDAHLLGVCVSGMGPCLLLTDDELRPVRPAILYGIDMRATAEITELTRHFGRDAILRRCGKALSTQAVGPKMLWVKHNEPEAWSRATHWFNSSSFAVAKLTGSYILDHHTASQCDPLYDLRQGDWAHDWAADVVGHLRVPELAWPHEVVGRVTSEAAQLTGLPEGTPVSAGTVDAWSEAFSAGARREGDLMLMYGSTMFFVQVLPDLQTHPLLWTTAGVEPGQYTLAAGMSTSGSLTGWVQQLVGDVPFATLVEEAAAVPPGSDGLVLLPYFAGERTPIFDPRARGVIAGLSLRHHRGHLYRAVYEGIAYGIRQIVEFLDGENTPIQRLVAVGGGTQGGLWTQIVSDVVGREQVIPEQTVGAAYGDALLAAIGTGAVPPETDWARVGRIVQPDAATRDTYQTLFGVYEDLYPATKSLVHTLAQMQESTSR